MSFESSRDPASVEATFEYIDAKIRRDADGTAFGGDFEWLCRWFLENAPRYRAQFDKVWLWKDWPDRWGPDAGIDLVARTRTGELWAIQCKADHPDRAITKREINSFLSESNRPQFAYRLLMATTDAIGATARRTLHGQEKPVGLVLRGHFLTEEVQWPVQIGGTAARLDRWKARPHQLTAIKAVVNGFRDHDRARLIMACGTGKTLTALWIAERLRSCGRSPDRATAAGPQVSLNSSNMPIANAKGEQETCGQSPVRGQETRAQQSAGSGAPRTTRFFDAGARPVALAGAAEPGRVGPSLRRGF